MGSQESLKPAAYEESEALRELRRDFLDGDRPNMLYSPGVVDVAFRQE
jgi:hypothetical protein